MASLLKNTFFSSITLVLRFLCNAILFILIARTFGPEEFGKLAFAIALTGIFMVIVDYGFNLLIVREVAVSPNNAIAIANRVISGKIILSILSSAIIAVTTVALNYSHETLIIISILWFAAVLYSFGFFFNTIFRGLNQFQYETYPTFFLYVIQFAFVVILLTLNFRSRAIAIVFLLSRLIYFVVSLILVSNKIGRLSFVPDFKGGFKILKESMPFGIHAILATIYFQIDTVFLAHYCGNTEVGYYQAATRLVTVSMIIYEVITSSFYPLISKKFMYDSSGYREDGFAFNRYMLLVGGGLSVFFILFADMIIRLLYGTGYEQSILILRLMTVVIFIRFAGGAYATFITVADNQRLRAIGVGASAVVNILLNILLIPAYGGVGAAIASIITHLVLISLYIIFSLRLNGSWFIDKYCIKGFAVLAVSLISCLLVRGSETLTIIFYFLFMTALALMAMNSREKKFISQIFAKIL